MSASSPARDAERRRAGGTVLDAVLERITYANEETGYSSSFDLVSHAPPGPGTAKITGEGARGGDLLTARPRAPGPAGTSPRR